MIAKDGYAINKATVCGIMKLQDKNPEGNRAKPRNPRKEVKVTKMKIVAVEYYRLSI